MSDVLLEPPQKPREKESLYLESLYSGLKKLHLPNIFQFSAFCNEIVTCCILKLTKEWESYDGTYFEL